MQIARIIDASNILRAKRAACAVLALVATAAFLTGCGDRADTSAPLGASAIAITAPDGAITVTGTMQFVATVTDVNGNTLTTTPTWTVVNGGGTITSGGLFTAGDSIGTFTNTIVATIGTVTSTSSVTVSAGALASITITPETVTVAVGEPQHFAAVGRDAHGNVVAIPDRVWSVTSGGTIDTSGTFTAGTVAGAFAGAIHVTSGSITATSSVTVSAGPIATIEVHPFTISLPQGWVQQFTAFGFDGYGNLVPIPNRVWSVAASGGTIDSAGLFTAGTTGGTFTNTVTATSGAISGASTVTVQAGPLARIVVTPSFVLLPPGGTLQYSAAGYDAGGNTVAITPTWSVATASAALGTISSGGLLSVSSTATGGYSNAIVATSGTISGTGTVTVFCVVICGGGIP